MAGVALRQAEGLAAPLPESRPTHRLPMLLPLLLLLLLLNPVQCFRPKKLQHETQCFTASTKSCNTKHSRRQKLQHKTQAPGRRNAPKRPKTVHFACSTVGAQMQVCTVYNLLASKCCMLTFSRRRRSIGRACRVCRVCRVLIKTS